MIYVVTYATHSFGNYDAMLDNKYGVQFVVLGWGEKWNGYMFKLQSIYNYMKNLKDDDIIIQLDGFDVWVNGYLSEAIDYFKNNNHKVLFSQELNTRFFGLQPYLNKKIFSSTCNGNHTINAGMYMGYKKYLVPIIEKALESNEKDDQRIFNMLCGQFMNDNILSIDVDKNIFHNVCSDSSIKSSNSIFVQYPGRPSFTRWTRSITDYTPYLITEIILLVFLILVIVLLLSYRKKLLK